MTDDQNADLVGYEFDAERGRLRVMGSFDPRGTYVSCERCDRDDLPDSMRLTVRSAALVRRHRELHSRASVNPTPPTT